MERNKADKLLELGASIWLTGGLVECLRARLERLAALGYALSSEEVLDLNRQFNSEGLRFLSLIEQYEQIKRKEGDSIAGAIPTEESVGFLGP